MTLKKYQSPSGGLNSAGRAHYNHEGSHLKAPVTQGDRAQVCCTARVILRADVGQCRAYEGFKGSAHPQGACIAKVALPL